MSKALFFIGIIPKNDISEEITQYKHYCKTEYHSKRALNAPPHITLIPPFRYEFKEIRLLNDQMNAAFYKTLPFYVLTNGFDHFRESVLFINIEPNDELNLLQKNLTTHLQSKIPDFKAYGQKYHPHITIAFRDLSHDNFLKAWKHFRDIEYQRVFKVNDFCLFIHNGQNWKVINQFNFKY